jgi:hypothetical protein
MYQIVSPILYEAPVVQNMGLFLQGIEVPRPTRRGKKTDDAVNHGAPYHKMELLGHVKQLHIVHASSSKSAGPVYMTSQEASHRDPFFRRQSALEACTADALGTADLHSWIMVKDLIGQLEGIEPQRRHFFMLGEAFSQLKFVSFGMWDTGRWNTYEEDASRRDWSFTHTTWGRRSHDAVVKGMPNRDWKACPRYTIPNRDWKACPQYTIRDILESVFSGLRSVATCHDHLATIQLSYLSKAEDLMVIHNARLSHVHTGRRTRLYSTTSALQANFLRDTIAVGALVLGYDSRRKPVFSQSTRNLRRCPTRMRMELEICLVPEEEGNEGQLQLARDVRDALDAFERASKELDGSEEYIGRLKILVGDDIPACPCCGRKR